MNMDEFMKDTKCRAGMPSGGEDALYIMSVTRAQMLVEKYLNAGDDRACARIADYVADPENHVYGNTVVCHNLLVMYYNSGDYYSEMKLADTFLSRFPYCCDLLADAIQAAGEAGCFQKGYEYIAAAEKIDKKNWNWRLFFFTAGFYFNEMMSCEPKVLQSVFEKAKLIVQAYQKYLPLDERGFNREAELHLFVNDRKAAYDVLRRAIFDPVGNGEPGRYRIASQCCATMLSRILEDSDNYQEVFKIAQKGIQSTAQEIPGTMIGYYVYRSALARDAMIVRENYNNNQSIQAALREYQCAYDLLAGTEYARNIERRYAVLSQNAENPVADMPLLRRSLVTET